MLDVTGATAEIRDWDLIKDFVGWVAIGKIIRDQKGRWKDGSTFHTSMIVDVTEHDNTITIKTLNSTYYMTRDNYVDAMKTGGPEEARKKLNDLLEYLANKPKILRARGC